ncbi:MAG: hypothetical protein IPP49_09520 [Saprospiraceae bacterium]|nr:hypothetical protein [Saprospiraceae bacterium]
MKLCFRNHWVQKVRVRLGFDNILSVQHRTSYGVSQNHPYRKPESRAGNGDEAYTLTDYLDDISGQACKL